MARDAQRQPSAYRRALVWLEARMQLWLALVWGAILIAAVLIQVGGFPRPDGQWYLVAASTLILIAAAMLTERSDSLERRIEAQGRDIRQMRGLLAGSKLRELSDALRDFRPWMERLQPGETVLIEHLGLDMTVAWEKVHRLLGELSGRHKVEYRLLMLGGDAPGARDLPENVITWIENAKAPYKLILKECGELERAPRPAGGGFAWEVRRYRDLPAVHGFAVRTGETAVAYVAVSRWSQRDPDFYYWGGEEYHEVHDGASPPERDLLDVFDGYFRHWWKRGAGAPAGTPQGGAAQEGAAG